MCERNLLGRMCLRNVFSPCLRHPPLSYRALTRAWLKPKRWMSHCPDPHLAPKVLHQVERFLTADGDRIFRLWSGERDYKKHLNLATAECGQGDIRCILDYVRRQS